LDIKKVEEIARGAGKILLQQLETGFSIEKKGTVDLITNADRLSDEYIVRELKEHFPDTAILSEEQGLTSSAGKGHLWVVDPLDGTTNFAHGYPYFSVSIALICDGEPYLGVVHNPVSGELFSAVKGEGAYRNGTRIKVSRTESIQDSLLVTGFAYDVATRPDDNMGPFARVTKASQGVLRLGSAALDLCNVACGRLDGFWERGLNAWDITAGALMVLEAGGKVSLMDGQKFDPFAREIAATNGLIHAELLKLIADN
jgi:myo-inositol-1(or 4)-monophosphatase